MPHDIPARIIHDTIELPKFGIRVPIVRVEGKGDYFPMRALCTALGITSQPQIERIQEDSDYAEGIESYDVPTPGGPQESVCLRKRELAWWFGHVDPRIRRKLEARFDVPLTEFKRILMDACDALWWGVRAVVPTSPGAGPRVEVMMHLSCLRCRTPHTFTSDGVHTAWEIAEE
jgi:P22_AR N-terminal domain